MESKESFEKYLAQFQPVVSETLQDKIFKRKNPYLISIATIAAAAAIIFGFVILHSLYSPKRLSCDNTLFVEEHGEISRTSLVYMRLQLNRRNNISQVLKNSDLLVVSDTPQDCISMFSTYKGK